LHADAFSPANRPDADTVEEIVSTAFWASLRSEEGKSPKISLAYLPPEQSVRPLRFEPRLPLDPNVLTRLAPAVEKPGMHLGISRERNQLGVWGMTRTIPTGSFVLEVAAPGFLVAKYSQSDTSMKFANVAVLEGADVKFIEGREGIIPEFPPTLNALPTFYASAGRKGSSDILVRVAIAMRAHGRGGSLLIVPQNSTEWRTSIVRPVTYTVIPPSPDIHTFLQLQEEGLPTSTTVLQSAATALAGLTAVDGAAVISDRFEPLAFGVKILTPDGTTRVDEVLLTEPFEGVPDFKVDPSQLGGTRHLSAAQFAHDQRKAIAMVASQDGRFTVFAWSEAHRIVHAHRLEALLV
jgi:hypothetical protein